MKIATAVIAALLLAPPAAFAQRVQISHLDRLAERAEEVVNVDITQDMLRFFGRFIPPDDPNAAAAKEMVNGLKGIYVRVFDFGGDKPYTADDLNTIRKQLTAPGWARMVGVEKKGEGQIVDVHMWMDKDQVGGLFVLVAEAAKLTVVNIVGPIDLSKLPALQGKMGIPELPAIAITDKPGK